MKVTFLSDIHGELPKLPGGDLLILAGDYTAADKITQWIRFFGWLDEQKYTKKILIGGNHDNFLEQCCSTQEARCLQVKIGDNFEYLKDNGTEFEGLKIWGSPWTKKFFNQNPAAMAFALDIDEQMREKWELIPKGIDILVTHSPPMGILDNAHNTRCGCPELRKIVARVAPKYHCFGHIHSHGGMTTTRDGCTYINAAYMDEGYRPIHNIVTLEI